MKIFITGITGYVGSNLISGLIQGDFEITCMVRSPEKCKKNNLFNNCKIIQGDVTKRDDFRGKLNNVDIVIHLAAATPITNLNADKSIYYNTNVIGTQNLLEECIISKPKRIIYFSSTAAIGRHQVNFINEKTPLNPVNDYGKSKKEGDELILLYIKRYQLPIITICFPHIYGPGEVHELLKIIKLIKKGLLPQVGFGPNLLPMVYISDAIDAILLAFNKGRTGEKYIIADDGAHEIRMLRRIILSSLGIKRKFYPFIPKYAGILGAHFLEVLFKLIGARTPIKAENIKSIVAARRLSINKAKNELGFIPKVSFEEGINNTIAWYKENHLI